MTRFSLCLLASLAWISILLVPFEAGAGNPKPLLMEGKKTLYQRVITHPEAVSHKTPSEATEDKKKIVPFSVFYIYERKNNDGQNWLQVAPDTLGRNLSWIKAETASDWKQSLVLLFAGRVTREPLLFFKEADDISTIAGEGDIDQALATLRSKFQTLAKEKTTPPDSFPVLAMEPGNESGSVPYDHFYLMPIFSYQEPFEGVKFLEVASIDPGSGPQADPKDKSGDGSNKNKNDPKVKNALAFVLDTTISMGPYIEKSRQVTRDIYDAVMAEGRGDQVALGIVAFRNSTEKSPGVEYISKVISPLRTAVDRDELDRDLDKVSEARSSTHSFNEDSLAGIKMAIEDLDWEPYHGRFILVITDAGPLEIIDPYISTMMTTTEIADLARQKNIKIVTLHIKSPTGRKNHTYAQDTYTLLSAGNEGQANYLSWDAPTSKKGADDFQSTVESLVTGMTTALFNKPGETPNKPPKKDDSRTPQEKARAMGESLGYSVHLEYLGQTNQSTAPRVVRSWIADKDIALLAGADQSVVPTVEVAVLLTKDQLSTLSRQLQIIIDNAERVKRTDAKDFFSSILSASAQISRDPTQFTSTPDTNLGEMGVLGEFMEGLPYKSDIMGMNERDWYNMSIGQQTQFINRLKSKLARYEEYDKDVDHWAKFDASNSGDWLYRVPLTMLP